MCNSGSGIEDASTQWLRLTRCFGGRKDDALQSQRARFRVQGLGVRVRGFGFMAQDSRFIYSLKCAVSGGLGDRDDGLHGHSGRAEAISRV